MQALMEADVSTLAGAKGKHNMVRIGASPVSCTPHSV
jgi:hypothetical protein